MRLALHTHDRTQHIVFAELAIQIEQADLARAATHAQSHIGCGLIIIARHKIGFEIDIEIFRRSRTCARRRARRQQTQERFRIHRFARDRQFEQIFCLLGHDLHVITGREAHLRKLQAFHPANRIKLDRALGVSCAAIKNEIFQIGPGQIIDQRERSFGWLADRLHETGQQIVDIGFGKINLDLRAHLVLLAKSRGHFRTNLACQGLTKIEP